MRLFFYFRKRLKYPMKQIGKFIQVGLLIIYPVLAILIWFIPFFETATTRNKAILSALLIVYSLIRLYRLVKNHKAEQES